MAHVLPPLPDAVAGKLAGVAAGAKVEVSRVAFEIIQAMRDDDAGAETGEIVIPNLLSLLDVEFAVAIEKAHEFPLFRVDAHQRVEGIQIAGFPRGDVFELSVAVLVLSHRQVLEGL